MLTKISVQLHRWAKGRLILTLLVAFVAFEAATLPALQGAPGGSIESLDARFFYPPGEAFSTVGAYGDAGPFWIRVYLTWDIVNPIMYTLIYSLIISWLFQRGLKPESMMQRMNVLPIGAGLFDLLENISIVTLLATYPARLTGVAWLSTVCTMSKVSIIGASTLLILFAVIKAAANRFRKQVL